MAKVTAALAAFSLACVLCILVANLARGEPAGYSIVVFFVVRAGASLRLMHNANFCMQTPRKSFQCTAFGAAASDVRCAHLYTSSRARWLL